MPRKKRTTMKICPEILKACRLMCTPEDLPIEERMAVAEGETVVKVRVGAASTPRPTRDLPPRSM